MKNIFIRTEVLLCMITAFFVSGCANSQPALNIYDAKESVAEYRNSGDYLEDVSGIVNEVKSYIDKRTREDNNSMLAIIFDIDETLLDNYDYFSKMTDFGFVSSLWSEWLSAISATGIGPVCDLFDYSEKRGITIFIITSRPEEQYDLTVENLKKVGCANFKKIYMKNDDSPEETAAYKSKMRRLISESGYDIIANIGDQYSDLSGGYSERTYKLPNHIYYIK